jgi:hypothetical protein
VRGLLAFSRRRNAALYRRKLLVYTALHGPHRGVSCSMMAFFAQSPEQVNAVNEALQNRYT